MWNDLAELNQERCNQAVYEIHLPQGQLFVQLVSPNPSFVEGNTFSSSLAPAKVHFGVR